MIGSSLVVRARVLEHLIKDGPLWGALRLLALNNGDEVIIEALPLDLLCLLLLFVLFGPLAWALIIVRWRLPLVVLVVEESANCLLASDVVCYYVHQLIDGLWTISP